MGFSLQPQDICHQERFSWVLGPHSKKTLSSLLYFYNQFLPVLPPRRKALRLAHSFTTKRKWIITYPGHRLLERSCVPPGVWLFGSQDSPGLRATSPVFVLDCELHAVADLASYVHHRILTPSTVAGTQ